LFRTEEIFDALFDRAASGEGKVRLFGALAEAENRALLHEKLCGRLFSLLFMEFPLAGKAGFDLHIIHDGEVIRRDSPYGGDLYGGYGQLFSWFAAEENRGTDGLDVVYDLREGLYALPMVYLKSYGETPEICEGFFRHAGSEEAAVRFREKRKQLPAGWQPWYTGVHSGRRGKPLRIGSLLSDELKSRYAGDIRLFEADLGRTGFPVPLSQAMRDRLQALFRFPYPMDIQIDVTEDGRVSDMLGVSLTTGDIGRNALAASFSSGAAGNLMRLWELWEIADDRWKHLPAATFASSAILHSADGDMRRFILSSHLGYLKVRFRGADGSVFDAKAYIRLQAR